MLALIGALALLVLGSAAIIRNLFPDETVVSETLKPALNWAHSLRLAASREEEGAARGTNLSMRRWFVTCGLVKFDAAKDTAYDADELFLQYVGIADPLFYERVALARAADNSFTVLETATFASIIIGLATTIFAGLRGDDQTLGGWKRTVAVLAVVFPALGTAIAALAAFYSPREQLLQISQSLTALQQLHTDMQIGITHTACPKTPEDRRRTAEQLVGWGDRHIKQHPEGTVARLAAIAKASGPAVGASGNSQGVPPR
jgi:hypothetical protein